MNFFRFWFPPIIWMTIIFILSQRPSVQVSQEQLVNFLFFKTLHVLEYAFLYILINRAITYTVLKKTKIQRTLATFLITIAYAVSDEFHQTFVPTREGRLRDVIIDGLGATIAWISINQLFPKIPGKLQRWAREWQLL